MLYASLLASDHPDLALIIEGPPHDDPLPHFISLFGPRHPLASTSEEGETIEEPEEGMGRRRDGERIGWQRFDRSRCVGLS